MSIKQQLSYPRRKDARLEPCPAQRRTLTSEEIHRLLAATKADPSTQDLHDVVMIISNTGLRKKELLELRWSDVDMDQAQLLVNRNSFHQRVVPFGPRTLEVLRARLQRSCDFAYVLGKSPQPVLNRAFRQLLKISAAIGLSPVGLYSLRLTFLTRWVNSGLSADLLGSIVGWRTPLLHIQTLLSPDRRDVRAATALRILEDQQ